MLSLRLLIYADQFQRQRPYFSDAPLWKALIYFSIALLFLPLQRLLERIVVSTPKSPKGDFEGGDSPEYSGLGGAGGKGSMLAILLAIALINAYIFNQKDRQITTNDVALPFHARVERGLGGEVNQAMLDSFTIIMLTHKTAFESQYNLAQKTGSSEDYKIAYSLLKPWARLKDSVNYHTQALKTGNAKAESKYKLAKYIQKLREQQQQRIDAERKKIRDIGNYTGLIVIMLIFFAAVVIFSKVKVKPRTAELLLLLTFYMLFETLLVYSDTLIDTFIGNEPVYKIISNLLLAGIVTVTHEFAEKKMKMILFS